MNKKTADWTPCTCGEFWCNIHEEHAFECDCPPIDEWTVDPYQEKTMCKIEKIVNKKNKLIKKLNKKLEKLEKQKIDLLADKELRQAIKKHPALELQT